jgi:hypothetical protein
VTRDELRALQPGAIIRHKHGSEGMVVTANCGDHLVAVRTAHVTNATEWDLIPPEPRHGRAP